MNESFLSIAMRGRVVRQAAGFALIVGPILILINHWDTLFEGHVTPGVLAKMALTILVPYLVSTFSSVNALRERHATGSKSAGNTLPKAS